MNEHIAPARLLESGVELFAFAGHDVPTRWPPEHHSPLVGVRYHSCMQINRSS